MNTPQPSGNLARWGLVLQELELIIQYKPGKKNVIADALSRYTISVERSNEEEEVSILVAFTDANEVVSTLSEQERCQSTIAEHQQTDPDPQPIIEYLENNSLPDDNSKAQQIILNKPNYTLVD